MGIVGGESGGGTRMGGMVELSFRELSRTRLEPHGMGCAKNSD